LLACLLTTINIVAVIIIIIIATMLLWFMLQILGCVVFGIGVFLNVDQLSFVPEVFLTPLLGISCGLIVTAGVIAFLIGFIGCFGAYLQSELAVLAV